MTTGGFTTGSPTGTISGGLAFRFTAESESIALLQLVPPATTRKIDAKALIKSYLQQHHKNWVDFARSEGYEVNSNNLIFVHGTTKTVECVTAVYRGVSQDIEGSVSGSLGSVAGAQIAVALGDQVQSGGQQRPAPTTIAPVDCMNVVDTDGSATRKQCIFFNYYQLKRKKFKKVFMEAAAGPHELPPGDFDLDSSQACYADNVDSEAELDDSLESDEFETEYPEGEHQVSVLGLGPTSKVSTFFM